MRIKIKLQAIRNNFLILPLNYNELIQGFIYKNLDSWLASKIHDEGFKDPETERKFKFFTFSRLLPDNTVKIKDGKIIFYGDVTLVIASPINDFIQSFAKNLLKLESIELSKQRLIFKSVAVEGLPEYKENIIVRTLSPITVYSTLSTADGRKKTYYYSPAEEDFEKLIIENLNKKLRALTGKVASYGSVKPVRFNSKDQRIIIYKNTVVKGWDGIFKLSLPQDLFSLAFDSGLGAKNSQGFGCIEVWKRGDNR